MNKNIENDTISDIISVSHTFNSQSFTNTSSNSDFNESEFFANVSIKEKNSLNLSYKDHHINKNKSNQELPFISKNKFRKSDFEILGLVGRGAYAKVVKAKLIHDGQIYAIKIIDKNLMIKENKLYQIYVENIVLSKVFHPNIVKIIGIFEENEKIHIVLEFCQNGDFHEFLKNNSPIPYETSQFYTAQIVNILEYIHNLGISHRDLKPENLILDENMKLKLVDFATAKIQGKFMDKNRMKFIDLMDKTLNSSTCYDEDSKVDDSEDGSNHWIIKKKGSFVGSPDYVSPEMLTDQQVGVEADLWALGCIVYRMFSNKSPFSDKTEYLVFKKITEMDYQFDEDFPSIAKDFVMSLLEKDPKKRLGVSKEGVDYQIIKNHPFLNSIRFGNLNAMEIPNLENLNIKAFFKENTLKNFGTRSFDSGIKIVDNQLKIKEGMVRKKSPWFHYNDRKLILYNSKKLEYLEMPKNLVKGEIFLSKGCKTILVNENRFDLITPKRTFVFKTINSEAIEWNKSINEVINS